MEFIPHSFLHIEHSYFFFMVKTFICQVYFETLHFQVLLACMEFLPRIRQRFCYKNKKSRASLKLLCYSWRIIIIGLRAETKFIVKLVDQMCCQQHICTQFPRFFSRHSYTLNFVKSHPTTEFELLSKSLPQVHRC